MLYSDSHKIESRRDVYFLEKRNKLFSHQRHQQLAQSVRRNRIDSPKERFLFSFCKYLQWRRMIQLNFFYVFLFKDSLALSSSYIATGRLLFGGLTLSISTSTYIYLNVFFIDLDAHKNSRK